MRNLRRVEKSHPELIAFYRNLKSREGGETDDPKVGFVFVSKINESSAVAPETPKLEDTQAPPENEPISVHQPLSEQSQVLWKICERLEDLYRAKIKEISIPCPPDAGHSNHDRISLPISFENVKQNVQLGHYDLHPLLFHYNLKILLDNVVKFWGVNCEQFEIMLVLRAAYKEIRTELIDEIKRVWSDELFVNAMMDVVVKKPSKNRKKIQERQNDDEDIVNCHCGRFLEEGTMIQCQRCLTWQHVECAGNDGKADDYVCSKCDGKQMDMEILKQDEKTAEGHQCYLTLLRGNLQVIFSALTSFFPPLLN